MLRFLSGYAVVDYALSDGGFRGRRLFRNLPFSILSFFENFNRVFVPALNKGESCRQRSGRCNLRTALASI